MPTKQELINMMETQNIRHSGAGCSAAMPQSSDGQSEVTTVEELEPTTEQPPVYDALEGTAYSTLPHGSTRTYPSLGNCVQHCSFSELPPPHQQYQQQSHYANSLHGSSNQIYAIHQPTGIQTTLKFGTRPHLAYCRTCKSSQMTRCVYESSMMTHIIAAVLITVCGCCIPYLFDSCKSARHYCSSCNAYLGSHDK